MSLDRWLRVTRAPSKWSARALSTTEITSATADAVRAGRVAREQELAELAERGADPVRASTWGRIAWEQASVLRHDGSIVQARRLLAVEDVYVPRRRGDLWVVRSDPKGPHRGALISLAVDEDGQTWAYRIRGAVHHVDEVAVWLRRSGAPSVDAHLELRRQEHLAAHAPDDGKESIHAARIRLELRRAIAADGADGGTLFLEYGANLLDAPKSEIAAAPGSRGREVLEAAERARAIKRELDQRADERSSAALERRQLQAQKEAADRAAETMTEADHAE